MCTRTPPRPGKVLGPRPGARRSRRRVVAARHRPAQTRGKAGRAPMRGQAPRSTAHATTPPGPPGSTTPWPAGASWSPAPTPPPSSCPTWPANSSPPRPEGRRRHPGPWPWRVAHPLLPGPDHPCPGSGTPGRRRPPWPRPWAGPSTPEPTWPPTSGLTPATRRSGTSIRGEHVNRAGNKRPERAMFLSAFASLRSDPASRAYYQRKRDHGKHLGPGPRRPGTPPHPHPARHDPQRHPPQAPNPPTNYPTPLDTQHRGTTRGINHQCRAVVSTGVP